jgi:hypothetical protein
MFGIRLQDACSTSNNPTSSSTEAGNSYRGPRNLTLQHRAMSGHPSERRLSASAGLFSALLVLFSDVESHFSPCLFLDGGAPISNQMSARRSDSVCESCASAFLIFFPYPVYIDTAFACQVLSISYKHNFCQTWIAIHTLRYLNTKGVGCDGWHHNRNIGVFPGLPRQLNLILPEDLFIICNQDNINRLATPVIVSGIVYVPHYYLSFWRRGKRTFLRGLSPPYV